MPKRKQSPETKANMEATLTAGLILLSLLGGLYELLKFITDLVLS